MRQTLATNLNLKDGKDLCTFVQRAFPHTSVWVGLEYDYDNTSSWQHLPEHERKVRIVSENMDRESALQWRERLTAITDFWAYQAKMAAEEVEKARHTKWGYIQNIDLNGLLMARAQEQALRRSSVQFYSSNDTAPTGTWGNE